MKHVLVLLTVALMWVTGCSRAADSGREQALVDPASPIAQRERRAGDTLAYEHVVDIELGRDLLAVRMREVQDACQADKNSGCTLLDVSFSDEPTPRGSIRMRLAPGGVDAIVGIAGKDGTLAARTTHAEDLAEPVADTERQLALLTAHRDRLADFQKSKSLNVDQLITVSRELATVQTQIDQLGSTRANLRRRIDTDLLTINMALPKGDFAAEQSPVLDALGSFVRDLKQAFAEVIGFMAVALPWLLVVLPGLFLTRLFWSWISRWLKRRE